MVSAGNCAARQNEIGPIGRISPIGPIKKGEKLLQSRVPLGDAVRLGGEEFVHGIEDLDAGNLVALRDGVHHILALRNGAKDGVLAVKPWSWNVRDEELGTVRAWTGVGHGEQTRFVETKLRHALVLELVPAIAPSRAGRIAALDHKIGDDSVEDNAVIFTLFGEVQEAGAGDGRFGGEQGQFDIALAGFHDDADVFHFGGIWFGWCRFFFRHTGKRDGKAEQRCDDGYKFWEKHKCA